MPSHRCNSIHLTKCGICGRLTPYQYNITFNDTDENNKWIILKEDCCSECGIWYREFMQIPYYGPSGRLYYP